MDWFEEWFDSPLYEKLYANRNEKEAQQLIAFLEETLSLHSCAEILDLGCGRGRHSINLARKGYSVTGIDLSEASIRKARKKAENEALSNVHFHVRDMREPFDKTFDAIINLFTTFGYFSEDKENAAVFDSVASMLKKNGIFVLDYLNAQHVRSSYEPSGEGKFQNINYDIQRYVQDGAIHKDITFQKKGTDKKKTYTERVKLYKFEWFQEEMSERNLVIDNVFGDYKGAEFKPKTSPRMLILSHLER